MRYLHWCRIIHRDLKPGNIFVDWDWIIRIGDFGHCRFADASGEAKQEKEQSLKLSLEAQYTAPESFDNRPCLKSDVFSFGRILCELLTGKPAFPPDESQYFVMKSLIMDREQPDIAESIFPEVQHLIRDCLKYKPEKRPSFVEILDRLEQIGFKIGPKVNSAKVMKFVKAVKEREKLIGIEIDDLE
jgi:serine/threonine protein kinase